MEVLYMINKLTTEMIKYYKGDPKRINHFLKVFSYSKFIGMNENLDEKTQFTLETTALVHDIGIKISEEKYNSSSGKYQEIEGPAIAKEMLENLGYDRDIIERVCYLVGHHHLPACHKGGPWRPAGCRRCAADRTARRSACGCRS